VLGGIGWMLIVQSVIFRKLSKSIILQISYCIIFSTFFAIIMQFKATYKGTTKILSGQITNLPTLIESVKKKFPALFENGQFP